MGVQLCTYVFDLMPSHTGCFSQNSFQIDLIIVLVLAKICIFDCKLFQIPFYKVQANRGESRLYFEHIEKILGGTTKTTQNSEFLDFFIISVGLFHFAWEIEHQTNSRSLNFFQDTLLQNPKIPELPRLIIYEYLKRNENRIITWLWFGISHILQFCCEWVSLTDEQANFSEHNQVWRFEGKSLKCLGKQDRRNGLLQGWEQ